jgi:hypothetical protein
MYNEYALREPEEIIGNLKTGLDSYVDLYG